jgi:cyclopropane fatty-acyl-phospholipid synthase-like methyltransferase
MSHAIFNDIGNYYDRLVGCYGHDHRACDYGQAQSQILKFKIISQVSSFDGKSVLDVGCGFADFKGFLERDCRDVRYTGIDLSSEMVSEALRANPSSDIRQANLLTDELGSFDIVVANGIFYLLGTDAWHLMQQLIARMFACANTAVAFNSLSSLAKVQEVNEFYADPARVLTFCLTLTPHVVIRHDYHDRDFSVFMYKVRPELILG